MSTEHCEHCGDSYDDHTHDDLILCAIALGVPGLAPTPTKEEKETWLTDEWKPC